MAEIEVNGGIVVYDLIGPEDGEVLTVTPGGRFSKDYPGVRPFAEALADRGKRVLIWDRPNTGASDVQLYGRSESHMRAETLAGIVTRLGLGPVVVLGGSGGARDSIVFAIEYPELVRKLLVWSIVGGAFSSMSLASVYVLDEIRTIRRGGIDGILALKGKAGSWSDLVRANPRNLQRLRDLGAAEFERVMWRWFEAYVPKATEAIPGVADHEIRGIDVPTLIVRGGEADIDHPKRTSFEVHALIRGSRLIEPPWPEDAWERAQEARDAGKGGIFDPWLKAVPTFLDFIDEPVEPAEGAAP
ncbi:pimeloyl-ACP methyl ester carboxylesterase [Actinocorallia herbida]|uniref:Pimeloyl-ACP methyl ester carboxylesterase n=1 Tax=Actinocorallia herbida TaxID=58109 RepID=A0A3N1CWG7_9ACTN|nr:alpha/beta hydrolase [Actinocorallia herbida]ROO85640.1 pimeloyl-ACP methyl ester carboxylesterase [Actinocorallia herbida]